MSWIHMEDEVGLIIWALDDHKVWGIINATAPNPVTNREFSKALGRALGRPAFFPVPKLAVSALRGGELADAVAGGARVLPRRALDLGYEFRHPELDEALRAALS
jgi:NAD dependent epimerase/dehydratase family enzyme